MRVAMLSPLPPAKSGIADYSAALAAALGQRSAVDVFGSLDDLPDLASYDATFYQIGNNGDHGFVYEEALSNPGIVVLHEANLHHLIAEITIKRGDWDAYMRAVEYDGGARAVEFAQAVRRLEIGPDYAGVPMLRKLLRRSRGLIVHSDYVRQICVENGYEGPVAVIPHGAWIPEVDGAPHRKELGLEGGEFLFGIFGHLKPYKRIAESLRAFRRLVREIPSARLILVGEPHPDFPVESMIESLDLRGHARIVGYAPIESFVGYLAACDAVINLRYPTVGESSGSMLRAMGLGKPVLVSDVGAFSEYPSDVCLKVPVGGLAEEDLIFEYLRYLAGNADAAKELGENARAWVCQECSWDRVAERYLSFAREVRDEDAEGTPSIPVTEAIAASPVIPAKSEPGAGIPREPEAVAVSDEPVPPPGEPLPRSDEPVPPPDEAPTVAAEIVAFAESVADASEPEPLRCPPEIVPDAEPPALPDPLTHPLASELLSWAPNNEARSYLIEHISRLTATLDLLPQGTAGQSILEMGCYMQMTPALREVKSYGEVRGCYYGKLGESAERGTTSTDGRHFACIVDSFDAERDPYPYPDGRFDVVLCTELFEHLGYDPFHCLAEVNRILKPGGLFLLTTPNVCSLRAITAILEQYHPGFFPPFMKPGADGSVDPRHHREYAPREIRMALASAGFTLRCLFTGEYWSEPEPDMAWVRHLLEKYQLDREERGECIFALGEKTGPVTERFPEWLYYG